MRRFMPKKVALAVSAAVIASTAQAVQVNPDKLGQVLIQPYYNVNNGFQTNVHIVNTTGTFKAVKIRFRAADDSQDMFDFNIYMSPFDVWTGTVFQNADGRAQLNTVDTTCTEPVVSVVNGSPFGANSTPPRDAADTREGYYEIFEMGTFNGVSPVTATS